MTSQLERSATTEQLVGPIGRTPFGRLAPLPLTAVSLDHDGLLATWQSRNAHATIGHLIENLETSGVLHNFRRVAHGEEGGYRGMPFADTDLYKTLEAIGWESGRAGRLVEADFVDLAIELIEWTIADDGYLNTRIQGDSALKRWGNLEWSHELYTAGHLVQAAIALNRGAADDRLLIVALRFVDRIIADLGDREDGIDGHPEFETAMVELFRQTGDPRHLQVARQQVQRRGHRNLPFDPLMGREYFVDHEPVETVDEAIGHAVRQLYFAGGVTDLYLQTGEEVYLEAAQRLWESAFRTKTYITGGQGSRHTDEAFGDAYELPPDRAYAETCAGIASFQWNWRLLLATGETRYAEQMETVLYNTIAAAVSDDGKHFFYTNPLQLRSGHRGSREAIPNERLSWFACACCPPNLSRLIAALHTYLATTDDDGVQLQLLASAVIEVDLPGTHARLEVRTGYPWDGTVEIDVTAEDDFALSVRIPSWVDELTVIVDGQDRPVALDGGYLRLGRAWTGTHTVRVSFPIRPAVVWPNPHIDAVRGSVALRRGSIVYAFEGVDQDGTVALEDLRIDPHAVLEETATDLAGAPIGLRVAASSVSADSPLYSDAEPVVAGAQQGRLTAIPYFAWGNRGPTAMRVWIPTQAGALPRGSGGGRGDVARPPIHL